MAGTSRVSSDDLSANFLITVNRSASDASLSELGIKSWTKLYWPPGKYLLKFDAEEVCYTRKGKVNVYPKELSSELVEFGEGDLVTFPKGFSCTWDVSLPTHLYYKLASS